MRYIVAFLILFLHWIAWSGRFDALHITLGILSSALVAFMSCDLLFSRKRFAPGMVSEVICFIRYIPWLFYQILLSNIHVAYLVLSPKMPIEPAIIKYKSRLKTDLSLTTFANSITLTPGTITADIRDGEFYVHALSRKVSDDLLTGEMEKKVARIFED